MRPESPNAAELSEREQQILRLVATGAGNKQIAQQLVISPNTVKVHLRNIFSKIGVATRTEAALYAMREGLVQISVAQSSNGSAPEGVVASLAETALGLEATSSSSAVAPLPQTRRLPRRVWLSIVVLVFALAAIWLARSRSAAAPTVTAPTSVPQWRIRTQMPTARSGLAATAYADQAYAIGGESPAGVTGANERYDPATNSWQQLADMPLPAADIAGASIGGLIYVPGGRLGSGEITNRLQVYDPRQNHWEQKAPLPLTLSGYALAAYEGKLYVFGGWTGDHFVGSVFAYDPLSDQWSSRTSMPTARGFSAAAIAAGKIFVMGGTAGGPALTVNETFNPDAEANGGTAWVASAPIPAGRAKMGIVSVADIVHVVGGDDVTGQKSALEYFPVRDEWEQIESPSIQPWSRMGLVVIGTNLYAFGGFTGKTITAAQLTYQALYTIAVPIVQ